MTRSWLGAARLLPLYRVAVLLAIATLLRLNALNRNIAADAPVSLSEVRNFYPAAAQLKTDVAKMGLAVLDEKGRRIGYVVRTRPMADSIIGYNGPLDTLIAFDAGLKVLGVKIRSCTETRRYINDVIDDPQFLKTWNGHRWDEIATDKRWKNVDGVSGASITCSAIADSIVYRLAEKKAATRFQPRLHDGLLALVLVAAMLLCFTRLRGFARLRSIWLALLVALGLLSGGDLLALTLLRSWFAGSVAWELAPGLALLTAAALLVPLLTRRQLYCYYLCSHGAAQELLERLRPRRWRVQVRPDVARALRRIPVLLLFIAIVATLLALPMELSSLEPFAAYVLRAGQWSAVAFAVSTLVLGFLIPRGYCKFGCPTGAVLEFVRTEAQRDRFGAADWAALLLLAISCALQVWNAQIAQWLAG